MLIYESRITKTQETANSLCPSFDKIKNNRDSYHELWDDIQKRHLSWLTDGTLDVSSVRKTKQHIDIFIKNYPQIKLQYDISIRDSQMCMLCGVSFLKRKNFHIDHIIPKSKFPCSHPWNLQLLCSHCNIKKGSKLLDMIPIFLNGAKYRTNKYFDNKTSSIIEINNWGDIVYSTIGISNYEEIINVIIDDYDSWADIFEYLGNLKYKST